MSCSPRFDVVIATVGRPSLAMLLESLPTALEPSPGRIFVVDDRPDPAGQPAGGERVEILRTGGRGPAAARNAGWRASRAEWVAFLDDDVVLPERWAAELAHDLRAAGPDVAAVQGRIKVPLPTHRRPTDWERNVAGLEAAPWASADIACRRTALAVVDGFDERFRHAYREDSDLAVRLRRAGWRLVRGRREVLHPVGRADAWISLRKQSGNSDDALMERLHGRGWRQVAGASRGRRPAHLAITAAGAVAAGAILGRHRRTARAATAAWLTGTAELAWRRIAAGPPDAREVATMGLTSAAIPFAATAWWLTGIARTAGMMSKPVTRLPDAVLLDRDGTLVVNVPFNGDPGRVTPMPGAREAIARLRAVGVPLAVVSNQSGIGRGVLTPAQVDSVNRRIEELLGPIGPWILCPHHPEDGCSCRKPQPGLLQEAARTLGVDPSRCAVVGDIGADVEAARAVGARPVLVPNEETLRDEVEAAPEVARDLREAVDMLIGEAA
jgi:histidinol-phosphate phosphatase family protein